MDTNWPKTVDDLLAHPKADGAGVRVGIIDTGIDRATLQLQGGIGRGGVHLGHAQQAPSQRQKRLIIQIYIASGVGTSRRRSQTCDRAIVAIPRTITRAQRCSDPRDVPPKRRSM